MNTPTNSEALPPTTGSQSSWFCYSPDAGYEEYTTEELAKKAAEDALQSYRDDAPGDGWSEDVWEIRYGKVHGWIVETLRKSKPPVEELDEDGLDSDGTYWGKWDEVCDYGISSGKAEMRTELASLKEQDVNERPECEGTGKRSFYENDDLVPCVDCAGTGIKEENAPATHHQQLTAVLQNVVGTLDALDIVPRGALAGKSLASIKDLFREAISEAMPEWNEYLKAVHEENATAQTPPDSGTKNL